MGENSGPTTTAPEFPLRLTDFDRQSRNSIIEALRSLSKYGIGEDEIAQGSANAGAEWKRNAREEFEAQMVANPLEWPDSGFLNAMHLRRVGYNFADYAVPKHDVHPASHYCYNEPWPRCTLRVREMGEEGDTPSDGPYRIVRIYEYSPGTGYSRMKELMSVVDEMEQSIFGVWWDRWARKNKAKLDELAGNA